jgi:hypothetical protein
MAGAGAADGCISTGAYDDGNKAVNETVEYTKRQANDLRNSWRNPWSAMRPPLGGEPLQVWRSRYLINRATAPPPMAAGI